MLFHIYETKKFLIAITPFAGERLPEELKKDYITTIRAENSADAIDLYKKMHGLKSYLD